MHRALGKLELIAIIIGGLILSGKRDDRSFPVGTGHGNSMLLVRVSRFRKDVSVPAGRVYNRPLRSNCRRCGVVCICARELVADS
jgi:hypothetical protein